MFLWLWANQGGFMTKELNKAIMKRSKLWNKCLKEKFLDASIAYNKQRNSCENLLRRTKNTYFFNININSVTIKKGLENCQTTFISRKKVIHLVENDRIVNND